MDDVDLENGNGSGNNDNDDAVAVLRRPDPADPHMEEGQPFTWLRAAPFIAATLACFGLLTASVLLVGLSSCTGGGGEVAGRGGQHRPIKHDDHQTTTECHSHSHWGAALFLVVVVMAVIAGFTGPSFASLDRRPRLEADG